MLTDYELLVDQLAQDDASRIGVEERDRAIGLAVQRYGKDRQRLKVEDLTPSDANTLPLPSAWEAGFSDLVSLEFQIGENPPSILDAARTSLYQGPSTTVIKTLDAVTVSAASVRASFSIAHVVSASVDSIPVADREPVACWAAALLCDQLASFYASGTDSTIQADSVRQQSKAQEYAARARVLRKRYTDELGVEEKRNVAAGTVVSMRDESSAGQTRLTHPMHRNWA